ncbi:hypothetical protein BVAVS116_H0012 (plasmid) [Borreliella valaisiana VS116]|uniref:Uncharacterized protein n=1 Tax=Borreliella valaisiana VS116 TaxID=445987 RepID=C0R968_BORVA|nr:hypothetical protein BVAVS116_H0012 [Borreliella valaisiana VS116]
MQLTKNKRNLIPQHSNQANIVNKNNLSIAIFFHSPSLSF